MRRVEDFVLEYDGIVAACVQTGDPGYSLPAMFKIDFAGNYIWNELPINSELNVNQNNENIVKTNDNGYVSCSIKYDEIPNPDFPWDPAANNTEERIWLWKVDGNGNFLWQRFYEYLTFDSGYYYLENVAHDMKATPDGGFIMAGEATAGCIDPPDCENFSQQGWMLKVDGCGCLVPGCDEDCTVGLNENNIEKPNYFKYGPNPVRDNLNVFIPQSPSFDSADLTLVLCNAQGQYIKSLPLKHDNTTYIIDTSSLSAEVYLLSLMQGNAVLQTERLVVIR